MQKSEIRKQIKRLKSSLTIDAKTAEAKVVFATIESLPEFVKAKNVLLYHSLPDELPTHKVIDDWCSSKSIFLPRVNGDLLDIVRYTPGLLASSSNYGIMEPTSMQSIDVEDIDIIIVPGIAFDGRCNRLGRGKGFYDRLLTTAKCTKIGVAFDCQIVGNIPVESNDIPMDIIITKSYLYKRQK